MAKVTEFLKYEFSEDEQREHAKELARQNVMAAEAEEEKKSVVAQFTEKIASSKTQISRLSRYITNGYEYRNIDCVVDMHTPMVGQKTVTRIDTGEVVKVVAMNTQELQETLPFSEPDSAAARQ